MAQAGQALVQQLEVIGLFARHAQPVQVKRRRHAGETPDDVQRQVDRVEFDMRQRVQQRARPSGEAGERCRSCCGDTSPGRAGRPGSARVGSRRRSVSTMGASSMARTAASLPAQSSTASACRAWARRQATPGGWVLLFICRIPMAGARYEASATVSAAGLSGGARPGPQPGRLYHCPMDSSPRLTIETDLSRIDARQWDALAGDQPFLRHAFCGQCTRPAAPRHGPAGRRTTWRCGAARRWPAPCRCT